jgi:hypothetical protein
MAFIMIIMIICDLLLFFLLILQLITIITFNCLTILNDDDTLFINIYIKNLQIVKLDYNPFKNDNQSLHIGKFY